MKWEPKIKIRVISVAEFPRDGYKIRKIFGYKSIFLKELL